MVDSEMIPFNHQIGQTGLTIRPKDLYLLWCIRSNSAYRKESRIQIYMLQSIQNENAAIFGVADTEFQADLKEILENYLTL